MPHWKKLIQSFSVVLAAAFVHASANAASFDCAKASTKVEIMICGDGELSQLDEKMSVAYHDALKSSQGGKTTGAETKREQRVWLKTLARCQDAQCVKRTYVARLDALKPGGTATPAAGAHGRIGATYATVVQYIQEQVPGDRDAASNTYITEYPRTAVPSGGTSPATAPKLARVFGMYISDDGKGFIFILKHTSDGRLQLEDATATFDVPQLNGGSSNTEDMGADGDGSFYVGFQTGPWGAPEHDEYSFQLLRGRWRLTSFRSNYLMHCTDENGGDVIESGGGTYQDYLARKVTTTTTDNCKDEKQTKTSDPTPPPLLSDFSP